MTEQPDAPAEAETDPPDYALEPDTLPNHPLRAQDVGPLISKEIG
jgi:hypothetical protein